MPILQLVLTFGTTTCNIGREIVPQKLKLIKSHTTRPAGATAGSYILVDLSSIFNSPELESNDSVSRGRLVIPTSAISATAITYHSQDFVDYTLHCEHIPSTFQARALDTTGASLVEAELTSCILWFYYETNQHLR